LSLARPRLDDATFLLLRVPPRLVAGAGSKLGWLPPVYWPTVYPVVDILLDLVSSSFGFARDLIPLPNRGGDHLPPRPAFSGYAAASFARVIELLAVLAQRSPARPFSAILGLDVIALSAARVVVMHWFIVGPN
jgi:hypothetical protein